jgi:hypothetical protein
MLEKAKLSSSGWLLPKLRLLISALCLGSLTSPVFRAQTPGTVVTVRVPGTANPYLAGMPSGTKSYFGIMTGLGSGPRAYDIAPDQSPVLVELSLAGAVAVSFTASGAVRNVPDDFFSAPDGELRVEHHQVGFEHGISDVVAPMDSLLGVFLGDDRPDRGRIPRALSLRSADLVTLSLQLRQVFFIGSGATKTGIRRRFVVPQGATRLFLATMDACCWYDNEGSFSVTVTTERSVVSSNLFSVDSSISYAEWPCLSNRSQCTPERSIIKELGKGRYHVILPAQAEWGASILTPPGGTATVSAASGTVCLNSQSRSTSSCNGPSGIGSHADSGFLAPDQPAGALVVKTAGDRTYFSVNDRSGAAFQQHEGYFEFDVTIK